ncbi:GPW/gp25 family protein [Desulfobaculum sp. SPO524]|uniref:GPW/gp25 family protein n=1 Tax=Desulfobaculum sp. SPO524 TaxID=3378071 RepID=UPI003852FE0D
MRGVDAKSGGTLSGLEHVRQSVRDILTTPVGSRVMRREYGSRLPRLVDAPMTGETLVELYAATAEALARWEPRLRVERVSAREAGAGHVAIDVQGTYLPDGKPVTMEGIII